MIPSKLASFELKQRDSDI